MSVITVNLSELNVNPANNLLVFASSTGDDVCILLGTCIHCPENSQHPHKQIWFVEDLITEGHKGKCIFTNSQYILQAIRYYAAAYGVEDSVRYFNATEAGVTDVTNILNDVFVSFTGPLNEIMNVDQIRNERNRQSN